MEIKVRFFLSQQKLKLRFAVMVTSRSHKPEDAGSNPVAATNDGLTQLVESYPDTVEVESLPAGRQVRVFQSSQTAV